MNKTDGSIELTLRNSDELLNETLFRSLGEARRLIAALRHDYNHHRPHSKLSWQENETFEGRSSGVFNVVRIPVVP